MTASPTRTKLVNILGVLGYVSVLFQWSWSGLVIAYPYLHSASVSMPQEPTPTTRMIVDNPAISPVVWVLSIAITIAMLIVCIILALKMPKAIGRTGAEVTHASAEKATRLVLKHQRTRHSKKARIRLAYRFVIAIKAAAVLLPLIALLFVREAPLSPTVVWTIGVWCFVWSGALFVVQHMLGKWLRIPPEAIW